MTDGCAAMLARRPHPAEEKGVRAAGNHGEVRSTPSKIVDNRLPTIPERRVKLPRKAAEPGGCWQHRPGSERRTFGSLQPGID